MNFKSIYPLLSHPPFDLDELEPLARSLLAQGINRLQLRIKNQSSDQIKTQAQKILNLKSDFDFEFILNDDPYLARELNVDGVHLGQSDMKVNQAREILGPDKIIGLSTHSLEQARAAFELPIDYIAVGAIFPSPTKNNSDHPIVGLETLSRIVLESPHPVVAIGGIDSSNRDSVLKTGVDQVALISGLEEFIPYN